MIKITKTQECQSYFKEKDLYDLKRERVFKITLFGWVVYQNKESYDCDLKDDVNGGGLIGFKKK
jgi:hypothetical protein